jgi:hypothetical protein
MIAIFLLVKFFLLLWWGHVKISLLIHWFANSNVDIVGRWLLFSSCKQVVNITGGASVNFVLLWDVTSVAGQIVFLVLDECLGTHF